MRHTKRMMLTAFLIAGFLASAAHAQLINVNFNGFTGGNQGPTQIESSLEGPLGGLGTMWNQFADEDSAGPLFDSTGAATTVEFTTNFTEGRYNGTGPDLTMLRAALTDFGRGQDRTLSITGLDPDEFYDISLVGYRDSNSAVERIVGEWTTTNDTLSLATQLIDNRSTNNGDTFVDGYNYVLFERISPDALGEIVFDGLGATTAGGFDNDYRLGLNGFQIQTSAAVPEPASIAIWALLGLGLGGFGYYRMRRKK